MLGWLIPWAATNMLHIAEMKSQYVGTDGLHNAKWPTKIMYAYLCLT